MTPLAPRPPSASRTELAELMLPHQANILGKVFGGTILAMIDKAGATASIRHAGKVCVTAQVDRVTFAGPIEIGELIRVVALITTAGRTSMEVEVDVYAMNVLTGEERLTNTCFVTMVGEERLTNTCFVTMVAVDEQGQPTPVPPLRLDTDEDRARHAAAEERMAERRARRQRGG